MFLNWSTASEENTELFEIEVSEDGIDFVSIGNEYALGTQYIGSDYSFIHYNAFEGKTSQVQYYRLKMIDFDGSVTYSPITEVIQTGKKLKNDVTFNNPFGSMLVIQSKDINLVGKVTIRDMQGNIKLTTYNTGEFHNSNLQLNTSALQNEIYFMTIYYINGVESVSKVVKQ